MAVRSTIRAAKGASDQRVLWLFLPVFALSLLNAQGGLSHWMDGITAKLSFNDTAKVSTPAPPSPAAIALAESKRCLTQAVYYEARGESLVGQEAVAQVVLNRVRDGKFRPTVCGVVFQGAERGRGCQFSFACDGSANRALDAVSWRRAQAVADQALGGYVFAAVGSATHYHTRRISPYWSAHLIRVGAIGAHVFYDHRRRAAKSQTV